MSPLIKGARSKPNYGSSEHIETICAISWFSIYVETYYCPSDLVNVDVVVYQSWHSERCRRRRCRCTTGFSSLVSLSLRTSHNFTKNFGNTMKALYHGRNQ
eukprot:g51711.t1